MSEVVTKLVIDADTSGAEAYTRAMDGAEQASRRGTDSAAGFGLSFAAIGAGAVAAIAGVKAFVDYVASVNKDLADLDRNAKTAGLSLERFQSIKFAANVGGVGDPAFNTGLQKSASLLNDATRNANSLSKLFAENGDSIKQGNGQLITENQLLERAANYIRNAATEQDKIKIAEMLGFTKEWVPFLEQGADAMNKLAAEAQAAGAVIDDETIKRATDFDAAWRKSSVEFSALMKSVLVGLLPFFDDLIERASEWIKSFKLADIQKASDETFKKLEEQTGIPADERVIHVDSNNLSQAMKEWQNSPIFSLETWAAFGKAFSDSVHIMTPERAAETIPGYAASRITEPSYPTEEQMNASFKQRWKALDAADDAAGDAADRAARKTRIPSEDTSGADKLQSAINVIERHTAKTIADTQAVGLGAAAQEEFRVKAQLTTIVQQAGGEVTEKQAAQFKKLADEAGAAALALAKAKVANDNAFGAKTAFLSQDDVAIATKLKDIYPNVAEALNSAEAAQMRFNTAARGLSSAIESTLVPGLTEIAMGTKSVAQGASDMAIAVLKAIEQMIIKIMIVTPLMQALQQAAGSFGFTSLGGAGGTAGTMTVGSQSFPAFGAAEGGTFGPGWGVVGEQGPELINVHGGGVTVYPNGTAPAAFAGGGNLDSSGNVSRLPYGQNNTPQVHVTLIESPNGGGTVTQKKSDNGGIDIEIAIAQIAARSAAKPGGALNRVMTDSFGSAQKLAVR